MRTIFVITVLTLPKDKPVAMPDGTVRVMPNQRSSRSWGWYAELDAARDVLHRNVTDLHETIYDQAVIEEVDEGVLPDVVAEHWFAFDRAAGGYRPCARPADLDGVKGFSLG